MAILNIEKSRFSGKCRKWLSVRSGQYDRSIEILEAGKQGISPLLVQMKKWFIKEDSRCIAPTLRDQRSMAQDNADQHGLLLATT